MIDWLIESLITFGYQWSAIVFSLARYLHNFTITIPKLTITIPKLRITIPKLTITIPKLTITIPKLQSQYQNSQSQYQNWQSLYQNSQSIYQNWQLPGFQIVKNQLLLGESIFSSETMLFSKESFFINKNLLRNFGINNFMPTDYGLQWLNHRSSLIFNYLITTYTWSLIKSPLIPNIQWLNHHSSLIFNH